MTEIERWLNEGAGVQEGLRLLSVYKPNPYLEKMAERHPDKYRSLLIRALTGISREACAKTVSRSGSFRENWPFLSEPDCPQELKILAADKITAWRSLARERERMFGCSTLAECSEVAKSIILFYSQNRKILSEFTYYKEHRQVLGKHPVFGESRHRREMVSMGILELERKRQNLRNSVWRLKSLIRSGDRPDLEASRTDLLQARQRELTEVEKMIRDYEDAYGKRAKTDR